MSGVPSWCADSRAIATHSRSRAAATRERTAHTTSATRHSSTPPCNAARRLSRRAIGTEPK